MTRISLPFNCLLESTAVTGTIHFSRVFSQVNNLLLYLVNILLEAAPTFLHLSLLHSYDLTRHIGNCVLNHDVTLGRNLHIPEEVIILTEVRNLQLIQDSIRKITLNNTFKVLVLNLNLSGKYLNTYFISNQKTWTVGSTL